MQLIPIKTRNKIANGGIIAAWMVVGIHVAWYPINHYNGAMWMWEALGHYGLFMVAVPFFFIVSGYFLAGHIAEHGWWKQECAKRLFSLAVPYLIWCAIYATLLLPTWHGSESGVVYILKAFGLSPVHCPLLGPMWFIRSLILCVLASPVIVVLLRRLGFWGVLLLWIVWTFANFVCASMTTAGLVKTCINALSLFYLNAAFYFAVGIAVRLKILNVALGKSASTTLFFVGTVLVIGQSIFWYHSGINPLQWTKTFTIPMLLVGVYYYIPDFEFPRWLTSSAFPIFLMHTPLWLLSGSALNCEEESIAYWIMRWTVGFAGSVLLTVLLRKFFPRTSFILFGGR